MSDHDPIVRTHFTATSHDGATMTVVSYASGRCSILRDNEPVAGHAYRADQMSECTAAFVRLAGLRHKPPTDGA